jgi:hypothetical protein
MTSEEIEMIQESKNIFNVLRCVYRDIWENVEYTSK